MLSLDGIIKMCYIVQSASREETQPKESAQANFLEVIYEIPPAIGVCGAY